MHKSKDVIAFGILVFTMAFTLSGCYLMPKEEPILNPPLSEPEEITYETIEAKRNDIERRITGSATFISAEQNNVFFSHGGGRIKKIYIKAGDEVKKGDILAELETDNLESRIKQQEIMVKKADIIYKKTKEGEDKYTQEAAMLDLELEQLRLEDLRRELDEAKLYASIDGKIVYMDNKLSIGDFVEAYQSIMSIADPQNLLLEYSGNDLSEFKPGMKVDLKVKGNNFVGEVVMTPANLPLGADDHLKNVVRISVDKLPNDIKPGDSAEINLVLDRREDVIVLPRNAVHNYMGRRFVNVLEDGIKREQDVEIGIETATEVEIKKGIDEGKKVIVE
ncbi:efflux RND transporter periplasmic adaptor subunit [Xylanivirga thermophila]|jgi:macrolide-specific efflux system membrane fusion protein|uniref:efflux RND transporter periplasmic adaptor subunit n=1 Tax=Xylanivirga thermophila TaxID=2496273 RepID=UPI00101CC3BA|nr:efflux RND transporter periplasmic adaptor subunit [Xylanivirga thermophila]